MRQNSDVQIQLIGLTGSLRKQSHSRAVLLGLQAALRLSIKLDIVDLDLPLYNLDHDGAATPQSVRDLRDRIMASDAVVIATPEYNHGIPGVLKNALDWASRPNGKSCLKDKPVLVISNSTAFTGGARAHTQANETLISCQANIVSGPQVVIGSIATKIQEDRLADAASITFALAAIDRLIGACQDAKAAA
ncbi:MULTISPECIES: NAD(P)H-dependent oxidoreductase [unclassified Beijerinckia]|uniref:NADPH-dependent FMN reductase n=1 Tax=unclassified Beijerinckia TaxID=2638183 RepID=UPI0008976B4A|nr:MULTISPECIES: NAD(P)H-dependent oxidoreductase [unclassified Beijerinckia]MDH7794247.1 chromate reductase [Beijerinckia sp. GAS462]SEB56772.1 chromate reductase [Beijerinckia sp. 28-YEA-48]